MLVKLFALYILLCTSVFALSLKDPEDLKTVFPIIDADGDDKISPLELRTFLRAMGFPQTLWETRVLLDYGDTNGDGKFDEAEYRKLMQGFTV